MKRTIKNIIHILFIISIISSGCTEKDTYDWKNIDPGTQYISGPDTIKGNDFTKFPFLARPRGGSSFTWVKLSGPITIVPDSINNFIGKVVAKSTIDTTGSIEVTETTYGGKQTKATYSFHIISFCPYNATLLIGSGKYNCFEKYNQIATARNYQVNFSILNDTLLLNNFFQMGWNVKYVLSKGVDETITMVKTQFWYNGELVEVYGKGTYNTCNGKIDVNYAVATLYGDTIEYGIDKFTRK